MITTLPELQNHLHIVMGCAQGDSDEAQAKRAVMNLVAVEGVRMFQTLGERQQASEHHRRHAAKRAKEAIKAYGFLPLLLILGESVISWLIWQGLDRLKLWYDSTQERNRVVCAMVLQ